MYIKKSMTKTDILKVLKMYNGCNVNVEITDISWLKNWGCDNAVRNEVKRFNTNMRDGIKEYHFNEGVKLVKYLGEICNDYDIVGVSVVKDTYSYGADLEILVMKKENNNKKSVALAEEGVMEGIVGAVEGCSDIDIISLRDRNHKWNVIRNKYMIEG